MCIFFTSQMSMMSFVAIDKFHNILHDEIFLPRQLKRSNSLDILRAKRESHGGAAS